MLHVGDADADFRARAQLADHASGAFGHRLALPAPGVEVLDLRVTGCFDEIQVVGVGVRHQDLGRGIESFNEKADFAVDGEVERAANALHPSVTLPDLRRIEESRGDSSVILTLEEAEEAGAFVMVAILLVVDLSRDAASNVAIAAGQKELNICVLKERVVLRREQLVLQAQEGRHPVGVPSVEAPGQADKVLEVAFGCNRCYGNGGGGRRARRGYLVCGRQFGSAPRLARSALGYEWPCS